MVMDIVRVRVTFSVGIALGLALLNLRVCIMSANLSGLF